MTHAHDLPARQTYYEGPFGAAWDAPLPDNAKGQMSVCHWLISAPRAHPIFKQFYLPVIKLGEHPELSPPVLKFAGATHELLILPIDPDRFIVDPEALGHPDHRVYFTEPDFAEQFTATDEEMHTLAALACRSIVYGHHTPTPPFGRRSFGEYWLESLVKTLAHIRGEEHAP